MKPLKSTFTLLGLIAYSSAFSQWLPGSPGSIYLDPNNYDKVGIGTSSPQAPLHIIGDGQANAQGWNKSIILDKNSALYWKGSQNSFFIEHFLSVRVAERIENDGI